MSEQAPQPRKASSKRQASSPGGRRLVTILFSVFVVIMLGIFVVRSNTPHEQIQADAADPNNAALVARGRQLYSLNCASCHGAAMEGQTGWQNRPLEASAPAPPLNATGPASQRSDQELFSTIRQGGQDSQAMPAFPALSNSDIWALVSAIKATWTK